MLSKRCQLSNFDDYFLRYTPLITDVDAFIESVAGLIRKVVDKVYNQVQVLKGCRFQIRDSPNWYEISAWCGCRYRHADGRFHAICRRLDGMMLY